MSNSNQTQEYWRKSREISERIVVDGKLVLETPASLGNGDAEGLTDMPLLIDPLEGKALLTGASIAGALRNYLRERLHGYGRDECRDAQNRLSIVTRLFGSLEEDGTQSPLIVEDAIGNLPETELRDGVRIDPKTRTAWFDEEKGTGAKFDLELLAAETEFPLRFELLISDHENAPQRKELIAALALALTGLERGEIHIGARKRRGYGQCQVSRWTVTRYDLTTKDGLLAWLNHELKTPTQQTKEKIAEAIKASCGVHDADLRQDDKRVHFTLTARFELKGSMLIRSGSELIDDNAKPFAVQPDTVHQRAKRRDGKSVPVIPGTSIGGVLRHRALRVANVISGSESAARIFVDSLFGPDMDKLKQENKKRHQNGEPPARSFASRLEVREKEIIGVHPLIHTRVRIDRFTGGAYESALFDAAPVFTRPNQQAVEVSLKLRAATKTKDDGTAEFDEQRTMGEIGLLLLLLKDLWTEDLAIGGESSIGRGRLIGREAELVYQGIPGWKVILSHGAEGKFDLQSNGEITFEHSDLEKYVKALHAQLGSNQNAGGENAKSKVDDQTTD